MSWLSLIHWSAGRSSSMELLVDGQVTFRDSAPHGQWSEHNGDITISFHYAGIEAKKKEHKFRKIEGAVAWELSSTDGWPTCWDAVLVPKSTEH